MAMPICDSMLNEKLLGNSCGTASSSSAKPAQIRKRPTFSGLKW
jgi:hypothetical protein